MHLDLVLLSGRSIIGDGEEKEDLKQKEEEESRTKLIVLSSSRERN